MHHTSLEQIFYKLENERKNEFNMVDNNDNNEIIETENKRDEIIIDDEIYKNLL